MGVIKLHKHGTEENQSPKGGSCEKSMTNNQLAEILDKAPAVISKWVTNVAQPNVEIFIQLAKILGVRVDDLLWTE